MWCTELVRYEPTDSNTQNASWRGISWRLITFVETKIIKYLPINVIHSANEAICSATGTVGYQLAQISDPFGAPVLGRMRRRGWSCLQL